MAMGTTSSAGAGPAGCARVLAPLAVDDRPALRRAPHAALFAALLAAWQLGVFEPAERAIADLRADASERPASGGLVLLEAAPAQATPAALAAALDRLLAAGAQQVAFADSAPLADPVFRAAAARAGERLILPVAARPSGREAATRLPLDADGRLRSFPVWGEGRDGEQVPSLTAALLGVRLAGAPAAPAFDFSIRAETLPRLGLGAAPAALAGKDVIVSVRGPGEPPVETAQGPLTWGELHALAYETAAQRRWIVRAGPLETLLPAAALMLSLGPWLARMSWRRGLALAGAWQAGCLLLALHAQIAWALSLDLLPWLCAPALSWAFETLRRLRPLPLAAERPLAS